MTRSNFVRTVCLTVAAGLVIGRFSSGEGESKPGTPPEATPEVARAVNPGTTQRTIYVARHTTAEDLAVLLGRHFESDPGVRIASEPNSNVLVIRTPSAAAMDDAMKLLSMVDRPARQIAFRVFVVELAANQDAGKADVARQPEVDTAELTGSADAVLDRLKAWGSAGQVASIKKYSLTVPENRIGELTLGEVIPMTSGFTMNATTRTSTPVVTMRDVGTTIQLRPRISATNEIVSEMSFMESRLSPISKGVELAKEGVNGPLIARGILNTRLQTTLSIQDGQSTVAVESKGDASPMLVVFAANIVDPHAVARASATTSAAPAITRSQSNAPAQTGDITGNVESSGKPERQPLFASSNSQRFETVLLTQLRSPKLRERLKLTKEQQKQEEKLRLDVSEAFLIDTRDADHRENAMAKLKEWEQKYLDLLTSEQKQIWAEWQEETKRDRAARSPRFRRNSDETKPDERPRTSVPPTEPK